VTSASATGSVIGIEPLANGARDYMRKHIKHEPRSNGNEQKFGTFRQIGGTADFPYGSSVAWGAYLFTNCPYAALRIRKRYDIGVQAPTREGPSLGKNPGYTLIDGATGLIYGPYETFDRARNCAADFPMWEIINRDSDLVDWSRPPAAPANAQAA